MAMADGAGKSNSLQFPKTSLASLESLSLPRVQEVVFAADIRCTDCQKRVADVISKMKEMDSVVVSVLEKKITVTCTYPTIAKELSKQSSAICRKPPSKAAIFMGMLRFSRR